MIKRSSVEVARETTPCEGLFSGECVEPPTPKCGAVLAINSSGGYYLGIRQSSQ